MSEHEPCPDCGSAWTDGNDVVAFYECGTIDGPENKVRGERCIFLSRIHYLESELADLRQQLAAFGDDPGQRIQELAAENECLQRRLAAIKQWADPVDEMFQGKDPIILSDWLRSARREDESKIANCINAAIAQTRIEPESKEDEHAHSRD